MVAVEGLGDWLAANGECIYGTRPWTRFGDTGADGGEVRYTAKDGALYAIVTHLPPGNALTLPLDRAAKITLLSTGEGLPAEPQSNGVRVTLPTTAEGDAIPVLKLVSEEGV